MIKYFTRFLATAVSLFVLFFLPVTVAHADPVKIVCTGKATATFTPGVTTAYRATTATIAENLTSCPFPLLSGLTGTGGVTQSVILSCLNPNAVSGVIHYQWNNNQASAINYTSSQVVALGPVTQVIAKGTVASGFGEGSPVTHTTTFLTPDPLVCLGSGITTIPSLTLQLVIGA